MLHESPYDPVSAILDDPAAPALVARLQSALEEERRRRQQFYQDIDDDIKAEFINGEVIVHSPVKKEHAEVAKFLVLLLDLFTRTAKLGFVGYEKIMSTFSRNDYEPDIVFFGREKADTFQKGQWKFPPPDFIVEVLSESTEERDRGVKFEDYAAHGVAEYWIIDPMEESVEQYFLHEGRYKLHLKADQGTISSRVVTGFSIDIRAMFDEEANLQELRRQIG